MLPAKRSRASAHHSPCGLSSGTRRVTLGSRSLRVPPLNRPGPPGCLCQAAADSLADFIAVELLVLDWRQASDACVKTLGVVTSTPGRFTFLSTRQQNSEGSRALEVKSLGDGLHDSRLHFRPAMHHLFVADADDRVTTQYELRVVTDVARTLRADMVPAVDLENQTLPEEKVDSVAQDPSLRSDPHSEPPQSQSHEGFQTGFGEAARSFEHLFRSASKRKPRQRRSIYKPFVERGIPDSDGVLELLTVRYMVQYVLNRVFDDSGSTWNEWFAPVQHSVVRARLRPRLPYSQMRDGCLLHP